MTYLDGTLEEADRRAEEKARRDEQRAAERAVAEFEVIGDQLPPIKIPSNVPQRRRRFMKFAKEHPGVWIKYPTSEEDPITKPSDFAGRATKGQAGFSSGFTGRVRARVVYIRYDEEKAPK